MYSAWYSVQCVYTHFSRPVSECCPSPSLLGCSPVSCHTTIVIVVQLHSALLHQGAEPEPHQALAAAAAAAAAAHGCPRLPTADGDGERSIMNILRGLLLPPLPAVAD